MKKRKRKSFKIFLRNYCWILEASSLTEIRFYHLSSVWRKSELMSTAWRCHMGSFVSLWQISVSNTSLCSGFCMQSTKWQWMEPPSTSGKQQITCSTYRWQNGTHLCSL